MKNQALIRAICATAAAALCGIAAAQGGKNTTPGSGADASNPNSSAAASSPGQGPGKGSESSGGEAVDKAAHKHHKHKKAAASEPQG